MSPSSAPASSALRRGLSRRGGRQGHRHRPHRHLRGDEFRQCRRTRLFRRAAAGAEGHDAEPAEMAGRSARAAGVSARLSARTCCRGCPLLARRRGRTGVRSLAAQAALMQLAEAEWMRRLMERLPTHGHAARGRFAGALRKRGRIPGVAAGWAARQRFGMMSTPARRAMPRRLSRGYRRASRSGTFVPGWKTVGDPRSGSAHGPGPMPKAGRTLRQRQGEAWRAPAGDDAAKAGGTDRSERAGVVLAAGAWSHRLARQFGDRDPARDRARLQHDAAQDGLRREAHADLFPAHGFVITPLADGVRVGGAVEIRRAERPPNFPRVQGDAGKGQAVPAGARRAGRPRVDGLSTVLPDSLPVIGGREAAQTSSMASATAISA